MDQHRGNGSDFLPKHHQNSPLPGESYKVFEPGYQETIKSWLESPDVSQEEKKSFIEGLINFRSGGVLEGIDFYRVRAHGQAVSYLSYLSEEWVQSYQEILVAHFRDLFINQGLIVELRLLAVDALTQIGTPSIPILIDALHSEDGFLARCAAFALGKIRDTGTICALIATLKHENWLVRRHVVEALGEIDSPIAIPALIDVLRDGNSYVRASAVTVLGKMGNPIAIPALIIALDDRDKYVRQQAVEAFKKIESSMAIPALIKAFESLNSNRRVILEALGEIGNPIAIPAIIISLLGNETMGVRWYAAKALGEIGDPSAIPALISAFENEERALSRYVVDAASKNLDKPPCW